MYNGNTVIEREIRDKYNEVFKIIGEKVGLRKLTYETYLGLNESDTRRKAVDRLLEKTLRLRDDADVCACIDTINKDVKREDKIDKIDSFFKLGEKIYPKEEKEEVVVTPTPDRLFEVNDEEEQEIEQEERIEEENKKDKLKEKVNVKKEIVKALKRVGIVIVGALDFISITLLAGAITTGILSGGLTFGTVALFSALPVATLAVIYRNIRKNKKKELAKKKKEEKNSKVETKEEEKKEEKTKTKTEEAGLDFGKDLDSPAKLDFGEDMEDKPLEADSISESPASDERDTVEESTMEKPEVETRFSTPDSEEPLTEPEYEERNETPATKVVTDLAVVQEKESEKEKTDTSTNKVKDSKENKKDVRDISIKNDNFGGNKMNTNDYKNKLLDLKNRLEMAKNLHREDWIKELKEEILEVERTINKRENKKQEITNNKEKLEDLRKTLEMAKNLHREDWIKETEQEINGLENTVNEREQVKQDFINKKERLEYLKEHLDYYKGLGRIDWVKDTEKEIEELSKQIEEHDFDLDYPNDEVSRGK